jgi:hypothetical protein
MKILFTFSFLLVLSFPALAKENAVDYGYMQINTPSDIIHDANPTINGTYMSASQNVQLNAFPQFFYIATRYGQLCEIITNIRTHNVQDTVSIKNISSKYQCENKGVEVHGGVRYAQVAITYK